MYELYKGSGKKGCCDSSRGTLLSDGASESYHGALRQNLVPSFDHYGRDTQCGGVAANGPRARWAGP